MSVKQFKFVSPGVFINEIDNSFIPKSAQAIGPVIVGRAQRGVAMQPVKVESYSDFVNMFGDTVPGFGGGDIYRDGNYQSPMYGTYAAKAFLKANVAPLTYVRVLGSQNVDASGTGSKNGWKTEKNPGASAGLANNGGAFGLFVWTSSSISPPSDGLTSNLNAGTLGAVFYANQDVGLLLSGSAIESTAGDPGVRGVGKVVSADSDGNFTVAVESEAAVYDEVKFNFDETSDLYVRERFNTNPQLVNTPGAGGFYPTQTKYWLGESYVQQLEEDDLLGNAKGNVGVLLPIAKSDDSAVGMHNLQGLATRPEAVAGWFIGQDLGSASSFKPENMQKLFRLKGRDHGEWINKNLKVSISKIRQSNSSISDYGTFSVILRKLTDTDNNVEVVERFDNLTLDPASPNFIARKIGDMYFEWNTDERRLRKYGEYPNLSKFVYVQMDTEVEAGATDPTLLPFGYYAPPKFRDILTITGSVADGSLTNRFIYGGADVYQFDDTAVLSGSAAGPGNGQLTGSLKFPRHQIRYTAAGGGLVDPTSAYFGFRTTTTPTSTKNDNSVKDLGRILYAQLGGTDPTSYGEKNPSELPGVDAYEDIITLNNIVTGSGGRTATYTSASRAGGTAVAQYTELLNAGYNRFTAPFWGGFDGFDITKPDPLYNDGMAGTPTEINSYIYNTWKRAIDTVADPEFVDINLMAAPGLTQTSLTQHMINVCEERADCMALVDLPDVYIPAHESYIALKKNRLGSTPTNAANDLKARAIDSSYGCTFYPWVQTRDEDTGQLVWIPPSVAMMGVLASSQAKSDVWFAPAGFNRGGLTDGAAGIPVLNVTERIISRDRDTLYEARINPIASFPSTGIVVFGQKTLQERQSALDRINVRRLVIYLKKQISILASQVLFEQNVEATWNRFKSLIEPFLANVKVQFGITDYRLVLDSSTTTPDLIDQNIMYAKIMVKPARAIEYIAIDFVVTSTGASFDD